MCMAGTDRCLLTRVTPWRSFDLAKDLADTMRKYQSRNSYCTAVRPLVKC